MITTVIIIIIIIEIIIIIIIIIIIMIIIIIIIVIIIISSLIMHMAGNKALSYIRNCAVQINHIFEIESFKTRPTSQEVIRQRVFLIFEGIVAIKHCFCTFSIDY